MRPISSGANMTNSGLAHAKHFGNRALCVSLGTQIVNAPDIVLSKYRMAMFSILDEIVCYIVHWRSKKQMVRIGAKPIITLVAYVKSFWYYSFVYFVTQAMRSIHFGMTITKNAITLRRCRLPFPASISFFYVTPKSIYQHLSKSWHITSIIILGLWYYLCKAMSRMFFISEDNRYRSTIAWTEWPL